MTSPEKLATPDPVIELIEKIAVEWDGCEYDAPGESLDIGDAIRRKGFPLAHALRLATQRQGEGENRKIAQLIIDNDRAGAVKWATGLIGNFDGPSCRIDPDATSQGVAVAQPDERIVKVSSQGVQFGNAWFSHEKITGYSAEQLNSGLCKVTGKAYMEWFSAAPPAPPAPLPGKDEVEQMRARKDAAYLERNQVVAALAKCFPSGIAKTAIEGWSEDWHGCVYIDLPTGQASWHFHDSHAYLFDGLPPYTGTWDGHDTPEKYRRLAALSAQAAPADYPPPQKYDDVLVPFVAAMRKELHANSGKGDRPGWLAMDANTALLEVYWHAAKLSAAVKNNDGPAIQEHSADVANMAMMVLDICGGLAWVDVSQEADARADALEQAATLVELEHAADATQGRRLAQIAQHIRDLKKRNQS